MSDKSCNPHLSDEKAREVQEWAKAIHQDLVQKGLRKEEDDDETIDIVQGVKEVIEEVIEKNTEE